MILGAYSNPKTFWQKGYRFDQTGINSLFVSASAIGDMVDVARSQGAEVYAEFPTLRGDYVLEKYPDIAPIGQDGLPIPRTDRFLGACPSSPRFCFDKEVALRELVRKVPLNGVWLDYLHFHNDFEVPNPLLDQSCFCDRCLERFTRRFGITPKGRTTAERAEWILSHAADMWTEWKCALIADFAARAKEIITSERPGTKLGIFSAPWTDDEYGGAIRSILGEDIDRLHGVVDVFSPMIYHVKCSRPVSWAKEYTSWLVDKVARRNKLTARNVEVWPIVEADGATPAEFATALGSTLDAGAGGVMFFALPHVAADEEKLAAMTSVYLSRRGA